MIILIHASILSCINTRGYSIGFSQPLVSNIYIVRFIRNYRCYSNEFNSGEAELGEGEGSVDPKECD